MGRRAGQKSLLLPVAGEFFLLTLPFIERGNQKSPGTQVTGNRELIRFPLDGLKSGKLPLYVRC